MWIAAAAAATLTGGLALAQDSSPSTAELREQIEALQKKVNQIEAREAASAQTQQTAAEVKSVFNALDRIPDSFAQIETAAMAANEKLDQAIKTTAQRVEEINQAFESEQISEQIQAGTEQAKQNVEDLKRFAQEFQAVTPIQEEAKQGLAASVSTFKPI